MGQNGPFFVIFMPFSTEIQPECLLTSFCSAAGDRYTKFSKNAARKRTKGGKKAMKRMKGNGGAALKRPAGAPKEKPSVNASGSHETYVLGWGWGF